MARKLKRKLVLFYDSADKESVEQLDIVKELQEVDKVLVNMRYKFILNKALHKQYEISKLPTSILLVGKEQVAKLEGLQDETSYIINFNDQ